MNILIYIKKLTELFEKYNDTFVCRECIEELSDLIGKNGNESYFIKVLERYLSLLHEAGIEFAIGTNGIEKLSGAKCADLYSMRFKRPNVRIIFSVCKDGTILLLAFFEKEGKSKTEYEAYIPIASHRLEKIIGDGGLSL